VVDRRFVGWNRVVAWLNAIDRVRAETFAHHGWLDPLRTRADFATMLAQAERRHLEARADFVSAGGETLLGIET